MSSSDPGRDDCGAQQALELLWSGFHGSAYPDAGERRWSGKLAKALLEAGSTLPARGRALAAWRLVAGVGSDPAAAPEFADLARDVLGRPLREAVAVAHQAHPSSIVPDGECGVLESRRRVAFEGDLATGVAEICIATPLDELAPLLHPSTWDRTLFWHAGPDRPGVAELARGDRGARPARLRLPWQAETRAPLDFDLSLGGLACRIDLATDLAQAITGGPVRHLNGFVELSKEPGRPRVTRMTHVKSVDFGELRGGISRTSLLCYWIELESLLLAAPAS